MTDSSVKVFSGGTDVHFNDLLLLFIISIYRELRLYEFWHVLLQKQNVNVCESSTTSFIHSSSTPASLDKRWRHPTPINLRVFGLLKDIQVTMFHIENTQLATT